MSRKMLERKLDRAVREIVLSRDSRCITCDCELTEFNATPGHYMKRRHRTTRWDTRNVNGQCLECNVEDDNEAYRDAMIRRYGAKVTREIEVLAHTEIHFTESELKIFLIKMRSENNL